MPSKAGRLGGRVGEAEPDHLKATANNADEFPGENPTITGSSLVERAVPRSPETLFAQSADQG
jgi:hypothetical protein